MTNLMTLLNSPHQAATVYSQNGAFPKQRHTFLVRFHLNTGSSLPALTYAVKSVDRPSVQPHSEELNQYNRKRHIYTGYKIQPLKMTFYDDEASSALMMWANYLRYYFGDFSQGAQAFNGSDIVGPTLNDTKNNFGFTAQNGNKTDTDSQFFFKSIEVCHVHGKTFDLYTLVNPKISGFDPDDLDYEQSGVATISAQFVYEALLFTPGADSASTLPELQTGQPFDARPVAVPGNDPQYTIPSYTPSSDLDPSGLVGAVENLFGNIGGSVGQAADALSDYRYYSGANGGGLGVFGNFGFGTGGNGNFAQTLTAAALGNPGLAAALALGGNNNPLASGVSLANGLPVTTGISGALYQQAAMFANQATGGQGSSSFGQNLSKGLLTAALLGAAGGATTGLRAAFGANGVVMPPAAYSLLNAQGSGTAQMGYNGNITALGADYGFQGPAGVLDGTITNSIGGPPLAVVAANTAALQAAADDLPIPPVPPAYVPPPSDPSSADASQSTVDYNDLDTGLS